MNTTFHTFKDMFLPILRSSVSKTLVPKSSFTKCKDWAITERSRYIDLKH